MGPRPDFHPDALQGESVDFQYSWEPVPPEAALYLDWQESSVTLADGEKVPLRKPVLRIEKLAFGPLGEGAMLSLRNTPPLFGLGLLEAVSEETVLGIAEAQNKLGLNGRRLSRVPETREPQRSRESFRNMSREEREALVRFLVAI